LKTAVLNAPFLGGRFSRTSRSPAILKSGTIYWPFWLAHGTGALEQAGHEVLFLDCPARGFTEEDMFSMVAEWSPRLIAVDTSTAAIYSDLRIASMLKKAHPGSSVFLLGTHASALPEECLGLAPTLDGVVVGEDDSTLVEIAAAVE
jgi:radical SAM superfamily enzyme YgiQ (UPF0313 family)